MSNQKLYSFQTMFDHYCKNRSDPNTGAKMLSKIDVCIPINPAQDVLKITSSDPSDNFELWMTYSDKSFNCKLLSSSEEIIAFNVKDDLSSDLIVFAFAMSLIFNLGFFRGIVKQYSPTSFESQRSIQNYITNILSENDITPVY